MKFVYTPEGADPRSWDFKPEKLMNAEAEAIERHTGWPFGEFMDKFQSASMLAIHGLLYVLLKRNDPTLRWESVQFTLSEIDLQADDEELAEARASLEAKSKTEGLSLTEQAALDGLIEQGAGVPKE